MPTPHPFRILVVAVSLTIASIGQASCTRYAFQSDERIRASLLERTPIGSSVVEVRLLVDEEGFSKVGHWSSPSKVEVDLFTPTSIRAASLLNAELASYWAPWQTSTEAYWFFDRADRLID